MQIRRIQRQRTNLSKVKKHLKILKDIFNNKISKKIYQKKSDLLKSALVNIQKRKELFEKVLKKIAKSFTK